MKKVLFPALFLLAILYKAMGFQWFMIVAAVFFAYTFGNLFAKSGGCYRCKAQFVASIMLLAIAFGATAGPIYAGSGLLLGVAAFT